MAQLTGASSASSSAARDGSRGAALELQYQEFLNQRGTENDFMEYFEGRSRMCKEIRDKIDEHRKDNIDGVCVMGLYGMGGTGKTLLCKALCNEFFIEFRGRVCHAELETVPKVQVLREVLKELSSIRHEFLDEFNEDELLRILREKIVKEAVFLALDGMSDSVSSIAEVKNYLSARLPPGSIVIVTTRALDSLLRVGPYLQYSNCMQMPELEIEEAKSLFVKSSNFEWRSGDDEELIQRCVERCRFRISDDDKRYHYHPLALSVLGSQLMNSDRGVVMTVLDCSQFEESEHPVFSILRKSFETLSLEDQLLYMDIVLFLPEPKTLRYPPTLLTSRDLHYQWLSMVHGIPNMNDIMIALERFKRMSLLMEEDDGIGTILSVHDLWHEFCAQEAEFGMLNRRRWVYEPDECSELVGTSSSGSCSEEVKRMGFLGHKLRSLERVNFAHFSNMTVLKISEFQMEEELVIDLSRVIHLKSLEVLDTDMKKLLVQGLPRGLVFLRFCSSTRGWMPGSDSEEFVNQIEGLKELQHLELIGFGGDKLPDMASMVSLHVAIFRFCENVVRLTGLSSKLINLRVLNLEECRQLRSYSSVGDLEDLEELQICCANLERLPNLRKLKKLRILDVSRCSLITELPGLEDLAALEELNVEGCRRLSKLPDMHKLSNLHVLNLKGSPVDKYQKALLRKSLVLIPRILDNMTEKVKKVKFYHRQCEHLRQRSLEVSEEIHALLGGSEMDWKQHSMGPLISSLESVADCMENGMALLQLCCDNYDQKVALALSFLAPHKGSFSQFALVIRDLDWHVDVIRFLLHNPAVGYASTSVWRAQRSKFSWCMERCRLVYSGDGENEVAHPDCVNTCLQADVERQAHGRSHQVCGRIQMKQIAYLDTFGIFSSFFINLLQGDSAFSDFLRNRMQDDSAFIDSIEPRPGWFWIPGKLEYKIITDLGEGSYKAVFKCNWLGIDVAIASLKWPRKVLEAEAGLLARVQHPNVVNLLGCSYDEVKQKGYIVTELMESNLRTVIDRSILGRKFPFDLPVAIDIMLQIVEAMVHVHECKVIYRDLKAENCLVKAKRTGYVVKLTDFGESKLRCSEMGSYFSTYNKGSRAWMAPEVMGMEKEKRSYTWSADYYSFGMTCYEILTGERPFSDMSSKPKELKRKILAGYRPEIPIYCPKGLAELMTKCWAPIPEHRPTFEEIRRSLWICKLCCTIWNTVPIIK